MLILIVPFSWPWFVTSLVLYRFPTCHPHFYQVKFCRRLFLKLTSLFLIILALCSLREILQLSPRVLIWDEWQTKLSSVWKCKKKTSQTANPYMLKGRPVLTTKHIFYSFIGTAPVDPLTIFELSHCIHLFTPFVFQPSIKASGAASPSQRSWEAQGISSFWGPTTHNKNKK